MQFKQYVTRCEKGVMGVLLKNNLNMTDNSDTVTQ